MDKKLTQDQIQQQIYDQIGVKPGHYTGSCPVCDGLLLASINIFGALFAVCAKNPRCVMIQTKESAK